MKYIARVAQIKEVFVLGLELTAATVAVRTAEKVFKRKTRANIDKSLFWSGSMSVIDT